MSDDDTKTEGSTDTTDLLTKALLQTSFLSPHRLGNAVPEIHKQKRVFGTPPSMKNKFNEPTEQEGEYYEDGKLMNISFETPGKLNLSEEVEEIELLEGFQPNNNQLNHKIAIFAKKQIKTLNGDPHQQSPVRSELSEEEQRLLIDMLNSSYHSQTLNESPSPAAAPPIVNSDYSRSSRNTNDNILEKKNQEIQKLNVRIKRLELELQDEKQRTNEAVLTATKLYSQRLVLGLICGASVPPLFVALLAHWYDLHEESNSDVLGVVLVILVLFCVLLYVFFARFFLKKIKKQQEAKTKQQEDSNSDYFSKKNSNTTSVVEVGNTDDSFNGLRKRNNNASSKLIKNNNNLMVAETLL